MKKLFVLIILSIFGHSAFSQIEIYGRYTAGGKVEPDINLYGERKLSKKVNLTYFALVESKWSEALVGFSYAPKDWFSVGLSAGVEHNPAVYRTAGSIWMGKKKTSLLVLWEKGDGRDNYWYKTTLSQKLSDEVSLGARAWRYHGVGPVFSYAIKKVGVTPWIMPAYDFEYDQKRLIFGVDIKM